MKDFSSQEVKKDILERILNCPSCFSDINISGESAICKKCGRKFMNELGSIRFVQDDGLVDYQGVQPDKVVFLFKNFLKKYPKIFFIFYYTAAVFVGESPQKFISSLDKDATIVNLGSGIKSFRKDVINVDYNFYPEVDVVADAHTLPFKDNVVDAIICENLLEHISDPEVIVLEMKRILKSGGSIFISTPFILGFHSSPNDYYRWTREGLRQLFKEFMIVKVESAVGPTSAMVAIMREWLAMILSFNINFLYQFWVMSFMVLLSPLNIFDFIISRYSFSSNIALAYYLIAKKK